MAKLINFCDQYWKELLILLLAIILGFSLGRITIQETTRAPIIIQQTS